MIRAILTDIEGTTTALTFVKDVLFPYARERLPAFVETHADDADVQHWLHEAAKEAGLVAAERQELIELLLGWIDADLRRAGDQVPLMAGQKIEHRRQDRRVGRARAQILDRKPGQIQQTPGAAVILQRPGERCQRRHHGPVMGRNT
jgi:hypothetical protein